MSVLIEIPDTEKIQLNHFGLGIDLGVKEFAVIRNGNVKKTMNKTEKIKKVEKKLKREQRCLSRKYEDYKKRKERRSYSRKYSKTSIKGTETSS